MVVDPICKGKQPEVMTILTDDEDEDEDKDTVA